MRGDLYTGLVQLAGQFPPSLNTSDDVTALKPYESPACYGVDMTRDGQLKTGTIPTTGTARVAATRTFGGYTYLWHYDRCWRATGANLIYGAQFYDKSYVVQGKGKIAAEATIVGFQPCLKNNMWVYGASGSQMLSRNAYSDNFRPSFDHLIQEMTVSSATAAITIDEIPYAANAKGIFSYNGSAVTEITRPVRNSLGAFGTAPALTADYQKKFLLGANAFAVDVGTGKLFDYSQPGFLFTSRTLVSKDYRPFGIGNLFISIQFDTVDQSDGSISWYSKAEDGDWYQENDINVPFTDGGKTIIQVPMENPTTTARKFAIQITGVSDNIYIRNIDLNVSGYDQGSFSV